MQIIQHLEEAQLPAETVLTIGAFDGVHRGHQALLCTVIERAHAAGRLSAVITFDPHPANVLSPQKPVRYITTTAEKAALLERLGLDVLVLMRFTTELANQPAEQFVQAIVKHLHPTELWIGRDFALGRNREGDFDRLTELGRRYGFRVEQVQPVFWNGSIVSSSRIRRLLAEGDMVAVADLLGWYYTLAGKVMRGHQRGRDLGYPTANIQVAADRALPRDGVYACYALLGNHRFPAVANLGVRPMFYDDGSRLLEAHLLDMEINLYDCDLAVEFVRLLRPEMKFGSIAELIEQMGRDVAEARRLLRAERPARFDVAFSAWNALR